MKLKDYKGREVEATVSDGLMTIVGPGARIVLSREGVYALFDLAAESFPPPGLESPPADAPVFQESVTGSGATGADPGGSLAGSETAMPSGAASESDPNAGKGSETVSPGGVSPDEEEKKETEKDMESEYEEEPDEEKKTSGRNPKGKKTR